VADIFVGISGWTYAPWRGIFYPPKHPQRLELEFASRQVSSIEINGTFYRLQKPENYLQWYEQTPPDFCFAVKASQFITHRRRLKDVAQPLANFFASGLLCLKEKLGPILWQLPPNLPYVDDRVVEFMRLLPHSAAAAGELAARHDAFVDGKCHTDPGGDYPVRHAFEFRHSSFRDEALLAEMRRLNIAFVFADAGEHALGNHDVTADHIYMRMHGQTVAHAANGYTESELRQIAQRIKAWASGVPPEGGVYLLPPPAQEPRDVFVYFDNDEKAHAPRNAMRLRELLAG